MVSIIRFVRKLCSEMTGSGGDRSAGERMRVGIVTGLAVFVIVLLLGGLSWWLALATGVMVCLISVVGSRWKDRRDARKATWIQL
jgi:type IV secretory pathway TrbD component